MATSLPLPKGFFGANNLRLTEERRRQYIEYAESSIRKVFALSDCHRNSWIPVREKKGVAVFRNFGMSRGPSAYKSNIAEVGGKGDVQASLDEIARAYAAHDDALFSRLMKKLNAGVLDAAVICTIVPRSPLAPFRYIGIKWFAVKTPTPLVSHRDYCVLEVQDKIVDAFGNEMYIRLLNSIDINECPSLENSHGLVRAKMLAGFMYRSDRAEPHVVRIHHVARFDPAGYFPSQWAYKTAESQLVSSIVQIKRVVEKQQMNACTFVDKKQWVPNHERAHCAVCSRPFGTFRPRHHCRCCGEVICGKCSVFKSVDVPGTTLKNVRLCSICNMGVTKTRPNGNGHGSGAASSGDDAMSDISTSSVTSSSTLAYNEMNLMDLYLSANGTNPNTPSAYSTASGQSNLSMRSTASSRSVMDARHRAATTAGTPGTARFFKGGVPGQSIFSSSSRGNTSANSSAATTPARTRSDSRSLFNETNTPRSYIGGSVTPRSAYHHQQQQHQQHQQIFFGGPPSSNAVQTPRALGAGLTSGDAASGDETPSAHEHRKSIFKQNPLDLGYLRDSVRMTTTATATVTATTTTPATATTTPAAATTTSIPPAIASVGTSVAVDDLVTAAPTQPAQSSTTPTRARGESSAELLPPTKVPRLVQDPSQHAVHEEQDDVEMEDAQQQEDQEHGSTTTTEPMALSDLATTITTEPSKDELPNYEELFVRGAAHSSTSTTESSVAADAAPVQPVSSLSSPPPAYTPRKSFLGSLFSRSSLEAKPPAA